MEQIASCVSLRSSLLFFLVVGFFQVGQSQNGLIMNEASNGSSGVKEFYEMVVVGDGSTCPLDIRGWIIDDNNGDFSCGPRSSAGIARGHAMLSATDMTWSSVPLGAVILIYNDADTDVGMPTPDPTDSNGDMIYIVPISHSSIQVANNGSATPFGLGSSCPGTGNGGYTGNTYTDGGSWSALGMRNGGGDAAQTRDASGNYFHGISYGSTNMTGGPDNLQISTSGGSGNVYYFSGGDFRNVSNFNSGTALSTQTPGSPNDAANATFITDMQALCVLPVEFEKNLAAYRLDDHIDLRWSTSGESYFSHFVIERATEEGLEFESIGEVNSQGQSSYSFTDPNVGPGTYWYRLRIVDQDGSSSYSRIAAIYPDLSNRPLQVKTFPNPAHNMVNFLIESSNPATVQIFDLQGREVYQTEADGTLQIPVQDLGNGTFIWKVRTGNEVRTGKVQLL